MLNKRSLLSQFLHFSAATVASLMVFSLYSIVDGLFVAKGVGEYAMSAVNLAVPFMNVMFSIAVLFAVGTSTIIAIYLGEGRRENANRLFSQNLAVLVVIGLVITGLVLVFLEPFAMLLGAKDVTLEYTKDYLRGLAPFAVCFIVSYNMEILVKTDGRPTLAIITVITGCLTNCVLDYVAIFVLDWGAWGAAFATGLSQLLTCVMYLTHFLGKHTTFHLVRFRPDRHIYRRLLPIGVADGATELCNGLMIFLFNRTILRCIGQDGLVSYTIIAYINTLILNIMLGVSQGSQPLVSYHYGQRDRKGCRRLLQYGLVTLAGMTALCFGAVQLFAPQIVHIFLGDNKWFPFTIILTHIWKEFGYGTIVYLAAVTGVNVDLYEAASIDGVNAWQNFWQITFPLIGPFFTINMVLSLKNSLGAFDQIMALTKGGPDSKTETVSYLIFQNGLGNGEYSYQMANAVTFFIVLAILAFVQLKFFSGKEKV